MNGMGELEVELHASAAVRHEQPVRIPGHGANRRRSREPTCTMKTALRTAHTM